MISFAVISNAQDDSINPEEAQKELLTVLQKTVQYRFSPNLKVGDKVEYKLIGDPENKADISLEVTASENDGIWIVEKYDGNELHMLLDRNSMELLDFHAFDTNGTKYEPELHSTDELEKRYEKMSALCSTFNEMTGIESWKINQDRSNAGTAFGTMDCQTINPLFDEKILIQMEKTEPTKREKFENDTKQYFSAEVPKMIPFEIASPLIIHPDILNNIEGGFVKNGVLELKILNK